MTGRPIVPICLEIISRIAAEAAGRKRFCTGQPCPQGHVSERYVRGGQCVECNRVKLRKIPRPVRQSYHAKFNAENPHYVRDGLRRKLEAKASRPRPDACEVCGGTNKDGRGIAYDHCHKGGHFRGWLCIKCNSILGIADDSISLLSKLIDYLAADKEKNGKEAA